MNFGFKTNYSWFKHLFAIDASHLDGVKNSKVTKK